MDIVDLNRHSSERLNLLRPDSAYGPNMPPTKLVQDFINRCNHPKTKDSYHLLDTDWEEGPGTRIIESLELYTHDATGQMVKKRNTLNADASEIAPTIFRMDPLGIVAARGAELRVIRAANPRDADHDDDGPTTRQSNRITAMIANPAITEVTAAVVPPLELHCSMTANEVATYAELVRVYDASLCHWVYDICVPSLGRLLNAERIKAITASTPREFKWKQHRAKLISQFRNTAEQDDILTFFLKVRDEGLTAILWVAERRSERALLEKDGLQLPEHSWVRFTVCFLTLDERVLLKVPADREMAAYDGGGGYTMVHLDTAITEVDPSTLKRFRQSAATSPLAKRLLTIHRATSEKKKTKGSEQKPEDFSTNKKSGKSNESSSNKNPKGKKSSSTHSSSSSTATRKDPDLASSLPHVNGALDKDGYYDKWEDGSLRKRLWDRVVASLCVRCGSADHLRTKCTHPALPWEQDFEKKDFWKPPHARQHAQIGHGAPVTLFATVCIDEKQLTVGIDTLSSVNTCLLSAGRNPRSCEPVPCDGLGGTVHFSTIVDLPISSLNGTDCTIECFVVPADLLPPNHAAIFGMPAIQELEISLDTCMKDPGLRIYAPEPKVISSSAWSVYGMLITLISLFIYAYFSVARTLDCAPTAAIMPGTPGGHPLFDSLPPLGCSPYVLERSILDVCWSPETNQNDPSAFPHFRDPPMPDFRRQYMYMQSAFVPGQGLHADIDVLSNGTVRSVPVGIDTLSDVNLALADHLHDIQDIVPDIVRGTGGDAKFDRMGTLFVQLEAGIEAVFALVAKACDLPRGCEAVLGMPGIQDLSVDLSAQTSSDSNALECYASETPPLRQSLEAFLGEKSLRAWLDANEGASIETKPFDLDAILVNPDLPTAIIARIREILASFSDVFDSSSGQLPKPFSTEPVVLNFKPDAVAQSIPEPRWTHALGRVITKWAEDALASGAYEHSKSAWAARPHVVLKPPAGLRAADAPIGQCKLRVCGDYRMANSQIDKLTPNLPTGTHELEKAAGHQFYWESDSVACYNSFVLAPGLSREALAIWTPIGLLQPCVLPFGQKNSGTEAQGPYRQAAAALKNLSNYVDDWLGYADTIEALIDDLVKFLTVCRQANITLNVHKTKIGFRIATFFGFDVSAAGTCLAEKHIDPLLNLVPPCDIPELRRVLGLFVVSRKYIEHYAMLTKCLTDLLRGRKPIFRWEEEHQLAFEDIRSRLLAGIHLSPPRYEYPFHLKTDASDDGKGGVLYQLSKIPIEQQYPYCPDIHSADNMEVVAFYSKCWTESLRGRPPFYLEADAILWGMEKARFYALSSPFPLYTYSDHAPLQWISKTDKGAVSSFLIENLSDLDIVHQYVPGRHMTIPDSISRYPMLGPRRLAPRGLAHSLQELLNRLPAELKKAIKTQVYAGENTADLGRIVQQWRTGPGSVTSTAPLPRESPPPADLVIMVPRPDLTPMVLAQYLNTKIPCAILMPVDLVAQSYNPTLFENPPCPAAETRAAVLVAGKLTFFDTQMIWIVGNVPCFNYVEMFASRLLTPAPLLEMFNQDLLSNVPSNLEDWIVAQNEDPESFAEFTATVPDAAIRNGLHINAPDDQTPKILVPESTRETLVRATHVAMFHLGSAKVHSALAQAYFWPSMASDCRRWLLDCPGCELEKARRNEAHALFSAAPTMAPRARWCMDFQGQGKALTGETEALALIDSAARYVVVIPLMDRTAERFIPKFLDAIVFTHGAPEILHSDAAQEFLSEALSLLATATNITTTTTLGHNAAGNSLVEVFWRFWNRCMRILPTDLYARWPELSSRICFAYNTASHSSLGNVSPFEIYHGVAARNPFAPLIEPANLDAELPQNDLSDPAVFAQAVATSAAAFTSMAQHYSDFERETTAERLNEAGRPQHYAVGDSVKIYVPPTHDQMLASGRRAKHLLAWRGPCTITEKLSNTTYSMREESTKRKFERAVVNILPYRASTAALPPSYDPFYSSPFQIGELIAVRDEPNGPFYVAITLAIAATTITVHYHGCITQDIKRAKFLPCFHLPNDPTVIRAAACPSRHVPYTGILEINSLDQLLVARGLEMTASSLLRVRSQKLLAPQWNQLFIF